MTNDETEDILQRVLNLPKDKAAKKQCASYKWENRREFTMETDEGRALLSSPNGRGAALILIRHKATFGDFTTIDKVTFWCGSIGEDWELHLMFHVKKQAEPGTEGESKETEFQQGKPTVRIFQIL